MDMQQVTRLMVLRRYRRPRIIGPGTTRITGRLVRSGPGTGRVVWWALGVVAVILVGLPLTVGLTTRGMASRPPRPFRPGYGKTGEWLHERYGLDWRTCVQVEQIVARGERTGDPALEEAVHGLAALIVSGRAPGQRLIRVVSYGSMVLGVGCLIFVIVVLGLGHHVGETPALIPYGVFLTLHSWFQLIHGPRRQRRRAARALELNRQAAAARLSFGSEDHQGGGGARDPGDGGDRQHRR
jgi:hypothetical protein